MSSETKREDRIDWLRTIANSGRKTVGISFLQEALAAIGPRCTCKYHSSECPVFIDKAFIREPSAPAAKAGDGWIRCGERMPPDGAGKPSSPSHSPQQHPGGFGPVADTSELVKRVNEGRFGGPAEALRLRLAEACRRAAHRGSLHDIAQNALHALAEELDQDE